MYAIQSTITKQWVYDTNFIEFPHIQRLSTNQALTFETFEDARFAFNLRDCDKTEFEIVKVVLLTDNEFNVLEGNQFEFK